LLSSKASTENTEVEMEDSRRLKCGLVVMCILLAWRDAFRFDIGELHFNLFSRLCELITVGVVARFFTSSKNVEIRQGRHRFLL